MTAYCLHQWTTFYFGGDIVEPVPQTGMRMPRPPVTWDIFVVAAASARWTYPVLDLLSLITAHEPTMFPPLLWLLPSSDLGLLHVRLPPLGDL